MKALLYCNKGKPYLYLDNFADIASEYDSWYQIPEEVKGDTSLIKLGNGKVVAEIEYDLEEIKFIHVHKGGHYTWYEYKGVNITDPDCERDICKESCMEFDDFYDVSRNNRTGLPGDCKAYMIKNIKIFDKPYTIDYLTHTDWRKHIDECIKRKGWCNRGYSQKDRSQWVGCAKGRVMKITSDIEVLDRDGKESLLIRCSSKELDRILNGEQTIIVRKK